MDNHERGVEVDTAGFGDQFFVGNNGGREVKDDTYDFELGS